jgi:hypothetical protein
MTPSEISVLRHKSRIVEKTKKKQKSISMKKNIELEWVFENCPNLSKQVLGKKSYLDSVQVIQGLIRGLNTIFKDYEEEIIDKAKNCEISLIKAKELFRRKFTFEERREIYRRLNLLHEQTYYPKHKKHLPKNLSAALGCGNRYIDKCYLLGVMEKEPQKIQKEKIYIVEREMDIINSTWFHNRINQEDLEKVIIKLRRHYGKLAKNQEEFTLWSDWNTWPKFFQNFVDFIEKHYGFNSGKISINKLNSGWFKYWNKPYRNYMEHITKEIEEYCELQKEEAKYEEVLRKEYERLNTIMVEEESFDLRRPTL